MCRQCGREACADCFERIREFSTEQRKERPGNPFFLSCARKVEHTTASFCPVSRFSSAELEGAVEEMKRVTDSLKGRYKSAYCEDSPENQGNVDGDVPPTSHREINSRFDVVASEEGYAERSMDVDTVHAEPVIAHGRRISRSLYDDTCLLITHPSAPDSSSSIHSRSSTDVSQMRKTDDVQPDASPSDAHGISVWPTPHYSVLDVTEERFVSLWSRGIPLVVNGLLSRFHVEWSPQYFIERYGAQACIIVDCEGDTNRRITVGEFFGWFGRYEDRRECWKLKVSIL